MSKKTDRALEFLRSNVGNKFDPEELARVVYQDSEWPKYWRHAMLSLLRQMKFRLDYEGDVTVERVSRLGAFSPAVFEVRQGPKYKGV